MNDSNWETVGNGYDTNSHPITHTVSKGGP